MTRERPSTGLEILETTNLLSNITAQTSELNQQPWKELEEPVRKVAKRSDVDRAYVVTGPLFERPTPNLPKADEPHLVPSGYFKIVILADKLEPTDVVGFILDQETARDEEYCDY